MNIYEIKNLSFKYDEDTVIFDNVSISIEEGKIYSLLGRNGVGKSTLFSILLNVIDSYDGEVMFMGKNIKDYSRKELAKIIGFVPQTPKLTFDYSAKDYVRMGLVSRTNLFSELNKEDDKLVEKAFETLDIKYLMEKNFFDMSGGEKQLVVIARSIVLNPKIILFDEPTSHLDVLNQYKVLKIIKSLKNKGYTIIVSTHDPNQVALLDESIIVLDGSGKISSGYTRDMISKKTLKDIYKIDMIVEDLDEYNRKVCLFESI